MTEKLLGVIPPMITPFDKDETLNQPALREVVKFLFESVHGYFICGTYGGGPLMTKEEKKRVADVVLDTVKGKRQVILNVSATNVKDAVELAKFAEKAGISRIASVPPYYYSASNGKMSSAILRV